MCVWLSHRLCECKVVYKHFSSDSFWFGAFGVSALHVLHAHIRSTTQCVVVFGFERAERAERANCMKINVQSVCRLMRATKSVFPPVFLCKWDPTERQSARTIMEFRLESDKNGPTLKLRMQNACDDEQRCKEEKTSGIEFSLVVLSTWKRVGKREPSNQLIASFARTYADAHTTFTRIGSAVASSSSFSSFSSFSSPRTFASFI